MKFDISTYGFLLFSGFVVLILSLVYLASVQRVELVTESYYEEELDFQIWRAQIERAKSEGKDARMEFQNSRFIIHFLPIPSEKIQARIYFYRPDNKQEDRVFDFENDDGIFEIDVSNFSKGYYRVQLEWAPVGISLSEGYGIETQVDIP